MSDKIRSNQEYRREELAAKVQQLVAKTTPSEEKLEAPSEAQVVPNTSEQAPETSEIEKQARALGWKSKEERIAEGKNNYHFVEADEYIRRQPLFERIDRQGKELRDLKSMNQQIAQHLSSLREEAYQQAARDLEAKRIEAINEGDSNKALSLERQAKDIETRKQHDPLVQQPKTEPEAPSVHPEALSFQEKNAYWYNTNTAENRRMMEAAMLADRQLAEQAAEQGLVLNPKEHLKMVEESVRRNFPHRFEATKQEAPKKEASSIPSTPMVGISTSSKDGAKSSSLIGRLTAEQRKIGEHFMRSNPKYTLEAYAKDLERMGRLK